MTIMLFAAAREIAGRESIALELPAGSTVAELRGSLARCVPALAALLGKSAIAVNHDFAEDSKVLADGDEVAVIPPVSGG